MNREVIERGGITIENVVIYLFMVLLYTPQQRGPFKGIYCVKMVLLQLPWDVLNCKSTVRGESKGS